MKGVVFLGDRQAEVREFEDVEPGPGEVRIKLRSSGMCGSDLHSYRQPAAERTNVGIRPGHEPCGEVAELGSAVTEVRVGDRSVEARLKTPEGYTLTAMAALEIARRVVDGSAQPGFRTPSMVFGPDFVLELEGTERTLVS